MFEAYGIEQSIVSHRSIIRDNSVEVALLLVEGERVLAWKRKIIT